MERSPNSLIIKSFVVSFTWKLKAIPLPEFFGRGQTMIGVKGETIADAKAATKNRFPDKSIRFVKITEFPTA